MSTEAHCPSCGRVLAEDSRARLCPACEFEGALRSVVDGDLTDAATAPAVLQLGDYVLEEEIARGGMGVVYRARQVSLNRTVAVKMLLPAPFAGPQFLKRFQTEAAAASRLHHPNIVAIHEIGESEGRQFFSMELIDGPNLQEAVSRAPFSPQRAAACVQRVAEASHYAHQHGVLHRDLKPSNILLGNGDQPMITDFGLAKVLTSDMDLTLSGQVLGTPNYLPPEQASGRREEVGPWSDVYGLGAVLYFLLTGQPPFQAMELSEVLEHVRRRSPVPPRVLNPSVPRNLETICLKCLQKDPHRRYATAREVAEDLGRHLRGERIVARPVGRTEEVWRWCRRQPVRAVAAGGGAAVLLAGIVGIAWEWRRAEAESRMAHRSLYESDMLLAQQAYEDRLFGRVEGLLGRHRPAPSAPWREDWRGWEWSYLWGRIHRDDPFTLGSHSNTVPCLGLSPVSRHLAQAPERNSLVTGSPDKTSHFWPADTRPSAAESLSLPESTRQVCLSGDGSQLLTIDTEDQVLLWSTWDLACVAQQPLQVPVIRRDSDHRNVPVALDARSGHLMIGTAEGWVLSWPTAARREAREFASLGSRVSGLALSAEGTTLAASASAAPWTTHLWDVASGVEKARIPNLPGNAETLAFSPRQSYLALSWNGSDAWGPEVAIWDVARQRMEGFLGRGRPRVTHLAFSPDERLLATAGEDASIAIWQVGTGRRVADLTGILSRCLAIAWSPDGRRLAGGGFDGSISLWSTESWHAVGRFEAHPDPVLDLKFLGAGDTLVSVSLTALRIWRAPSFAEVESGGKRRGARRGSGVAASGEAGDASR